MDTDTAAGLRWHPRATKLDRDARRAVVQARFSARRMVADHLAFYHDVVSGRIRPPHRVGVGSVRWKPPPGRLAIGTNVPSPAGRRHLPNRSSPA
jgi:hypothetical protein